GGGRRRNEMLQLLMLQTGIAILDESDSERDIDALKVVAEGVNKVREKTGVGCLIITDYQRLLNYIKPDHEHVIMQGKVVKAGGAELAERLENEGYEWVQEELGIEDETVEA